MRAKITELLPKDDCLEGRSVQIPVSGTHAQNGRSYIAPHPSGHQSIVFGMGCFWGAERLFWSLPGVYSTAVGYAGGDTPNPSYKEVCSGLTNHTEVVLVIYDPATISLESLLARFWQEHDPTQGMRQGNDRGTQYRSAIYVGSEEELELVNRSKNEFQDLLRARGYGTITTEIGIDKSFYYAEDYHQQYLHKVPNGYCGLAGTGVCFPDRLEV